MTAAMNITNITAGRIRNLATHACMYLQEQQHGFVQQALEDILGLVSAPPARGFAEGICPSCGSEEFDVEQHVNPALCIYSCPCGTWDHIHGPATSPGG